MKLTLSYPFIICLLFCACDNSSDEDMCPSTEMNLSSLLQEYTNSGFQIINVADSAQFHCDYTFNSYAEAMDFLSQWKERNAISTIHTSRADYKSIPLHETKMGSGESFFHFEYRMVEVSCRYSGSLRDLTRDNFGINISGFEIPYTTDTYKLSATYEFVSGSPTLYVHVAKIIHLNIMGKFVEQIDRVENYYFVIEVGLGKVLVYDM